MGTKSSKTKVKKEIQGKSVGRNVILIIDGKKFSKAFKEKEDRQYILKLVETYNKRNSIKKEKEIIELMQKGKTTEKERKKVAEGANKSKITPKKTARPKTKKLSKEDQIAAAKKLLEDNNYSVNEKRTPRKPATRREW